MKNLDERLRGMHDPTGCGKEAADEIEKLEMEKVSVHRANTFQAVKIKHMEAVVEAARALYESQLMPRDVDDDPLGLWVPLHQALKELDDEK